MRIAQISDVHIRNLKRHDEYRRAFNDLYEQLDKLKVNRTVNTGDTAHTKTQISPEFVQMASDHFTSMAKIAPYDIILGNHDFNLMNGDRQDAISPIVSALNNPRIKLYKESGVYEIVPYFNYCVFSLADKENYPVNPKVRGFKLGLFHGSIVGSKVDSDFVMTSAEENLSLFDNMDIVMMGDIHKRQSFRNGEIAYPGSLIQQNFGEEQEKGFLVWDFFFSANNVLDDWECKFYPVKGSRKYYTIELTEALTVPPRTKIDRDSNVRIIPPKPLTYVQQRKVEEDVAQRFGTNYVVTVPSKNERQEGKVSDVVKGEDVRSLDVQERLLREYLSEKKLQPSVVERVIDLNRSYNSVVDTDGQRARMWKIDKLEWSNFFNYGEGNVIDFNSFSGVTGIFAPNASGKSNMIDIILETIYNKVTKGISKDVHIVNDNRPMAEAKMRLTAGEDRFSIERRIEKVTVGKRKGIQKEVSKGFLNFQQDNGGTFTDLNEIDKDATERNVRKRFGTFEDMMLTSVSAQWNPLDVISCKETKRKEIFYKFLDLEVFDKKCKLAKEEAKGTFARLRGLEQVDYDAEEQRLENEIAQVCEEMESTGRILDKKKAEVQAADQIIVAKTAEKSKIEKHDVKEYKRKLAAVETMLESLDEKGASLRAQLSLLRSSPDLSYEDPSKEKLNQLLDSKFMYEKVNKELAELTSDLRMKEKEIQNAEKDAALLGQVPCGDQFPTCKFLTNAFRSKQKIEVFKAEKEKMNVEHSDLVTRQETYAKDLQEYEEHLDRAGKRSDVQSSISSLELKKKNHDLQVEIQHTEKQSLKELIATGEKWLDQWAANEILDGEIRDYTAIKDRLLDEIEDLSSDMMQLSGQKGSYEAEVKMNRQKVEEITELRRLSSAYEHFIEATGKDGIAYQILTRKLPIINEEINKILSNVTDFKVYIEHDQEEQSIPIYIQYGDYKSRIIELGSGAEKFLSSIAIRNALLNVSNLPKTNMFIIDEGFGKLDPKNLEAIGRVFDYLRSTFEHVIIISHLDSMKDIVDNVIDIVQDGDGFAHVEMR